MARKPKFHVNLICLRIPRPLGVVVYIFGLSSTYYRFAYF